MPLKGPLAAGLLVVGLIAAGVGYAAGASGGGSDPRAALPSLPPPAAVPEVPARA